MIQEKRFQEIIKKFETLNPILVMGDVGVDKYTYGDVYRISPEAPVPILKVTKQWYKLGLAANVSDNLKSLKVNSTLCGVIGDDSSGTLFEELLEENDLRIWGIVRAHEWNTTVKERITTKTQQICRVDYEPEAPISESTEQKLLSRLQEFSSNHQAVILEDYGKGLFNHRLCSSIINMFKEQKKFIAVDPSRQSPPLWYKGATLIKPNRQEAELIAESLGYRDVKSVEELARLISDKLDIEQVVITLSSEGMALYDRQTSTTNLIPTVASEVFDVSGAGDTAISSLTASLLAGATLEEAAWIGNCASGVVVAKKGTATVSQNELIKFYQELRHKFSV